MSEVMTIQETIEKVRETASLPNLNPFRECCQDNGQCSQAARLCHALSSESLHLYDLPDAWGRMMGANHAHLVIMLREAGAGHDPFGDTEWPLSPAQVWENLARVEQLPDLNGADLSGVDFKRSNLGGADLTGADLTGTDLRWAGLAGANLSNADLRGAVVGGTALDGADLTGANLTGVCLNHAYLDQARLDEAIGLEL